MSARKLKNSGLAGIMILGARLRISLARGRSRVQIPAGPPNLDSMIIDSMEIRLLAFHVLLVSSLADVLGLGK